MRLAILGAMLPLVLTAPIVALAVPAFPGAQGGGAASVGGRGGTVIPVTTLADAGTGSLRACVGASGPRTCVFRVSGRINLNSGLYIANPYLTVAGQTAPGGGIQIAAKNSTQHMVMIDTHDVIWRYTRLRHGYNPNGNDNASNVAVWSYNVVFDHNSSQWNQDEGMGVWRSEGAPPVYNVTLSNNIVAEGLEPHSTAFLSGGGPRTAVDQMTNIDLLRNLVMNDNHRNPTWKHKSGRIVNNIFYNAGFYFTQIGGGGRFDIFGNIYKRGPLSTSGAHEIQVYPNGAVDTATGSPSLHVAGNRGYTVTDPAADNWRMVYQVTGQNGNETGMLSTAYRRTTVLPQTPNPVTGIDVAGLETSLLPDVGPSKRLDCEGRWVPNRDSVDARLVSQYQNNAGITRKPTHENDVGGYPVLAAGTPCADADRDGMPDAWETAKGLDTTNAADRNADADRDGFTNLEEYLSGT